MLRLPISKGMKGLDLAKAQQTNLLAPSFSQVLLSRQLGKGKLVAHPGTSSQNIHLARFGPTSIGLMTAQGGGPRLESSLKTLLWGTSQAAPNPVSVIPFARFETPESRAQVARDRKEELQKTIDDLASRETGNDGEREFSNVKVLGVIVDPAYFMASGTITRHAAFEDDHAIHFSTIGTQRPADGKASIDKITKGELGWVPPQAPGSSVAVPGSIRSSVMENICAPTRIEEILALYQLVLDAAQRSGKPVIFHGHSLGGALNYGILALVLSYGLKTPTAVVQYGGLPVVNEEFAREILKRGIICVSFLHIKDPVPWFVSPQDILTTLALVYGTKELGVLINASEATKDKMMAQREAQPQAVSFEKAGIDALYVTDGRNIQFVGEQHVIGDPSDISGLLGIKQHGIAIYRPPLLTSASRVKNCKPMVIVDSTPEGQERINTLTLGKLTPEQLEGIIEKKK